MPYGTAPIINPALRDSRNADFSANPAIYLASFSKTLRALDMLYSKGYLRLNESGKTETRILFDKGCEDLEIYHTLQIHHLSRIER